MSCKHHLLTALPLAFLLSGCGPTRPPAQSEGHISEKTVQPSADIPPPVATPTLLPEPRPRPSLETYTVVVSDVPVKDLLFSMARDANLNLDVHNDIRGRVTLNALDQTLPQLLERISQQVNIRYELRDGVLRVRADKPFFRNYKIDYVNMQRGAKGLVRVASTIGSTGQGDIGDNRTQSGGQGGSTTRNRGDNSSLTEIENESENRFWETLERNIQMMIQQDEQPSRNMGDEVDPETDTVAAVSKEQAKDRVVPNRETGIIAVKATGKQHEQIQGFLDIVLNNARRQVMIEATIAEIKLSDRYQSGVDWSLISSDPTSGVSFVSDLREGNLGQSPFSSLILNDTVGDDQLDVTIRALERFGDVKVLSSPRVMAINNQPAILKVVDNFVYFEMDVDSQATDNIAITTFDTEIKTIPVGFVMSVTPYISEADVVTLNIRPTISRIIDSVTDPNPEFAKVNVVSEVPVIQVREIESVLQVNSGDTAIIGGLMQDTVNDTSSGVPFLSSIPIIGNLFSYKDDQREKSELVIFIRPIVIKHASLSGDLSEYRRFLPEDAPAESAQE